MRISSVDDGGLQIAKLLSERGKRRKKKIMKKEGRDGFKGIDEKKKRGKRKRQALVVASIEHPANTFGTRSTNLRNEI